MPNPDLMPDRGLQTTNSAPSSSALKKPTLRQTLLAAWDQHMPATKPQARPVAGPPEPSRGDMLTGLVDQMGASYARPQQPPPMPPASAHLDFTTNGREIMEDMFTNDVRRSVGLGRPVIPSEASSDTTPNIANEYSPMGAFGVGIGQAASKIPYHAKLGSLAAQSLAAVLRRDLEKQAAVLKAIEVMRKANADAEAEYMKLKRVYPQATSIGEAIPGLAGMLP